MVKLTLLLEYCLLMFYLKIWQRYKQVDSCRESGEHEEMQTVRFRTVVLEVSFFMGNPVAVRFNNGCYINN